MIYPRENDFNAEILSASQKTGVPVSIIKGFVALESGFNPRAYREEKHIKDASYGLMQILYKTAKGIGYTGSPEGLYEPATNVLYGSKFIRGLLARYPDTTQAIAAYNMGFPRTAANTTPIIAKLYGEPRPGWVYANQPYVDRVASYIAYYQTYEKPDPKKRAAIETAIKKKDMISARAFLRNPYWLSKEVPA